MSSKGPLWAEFACLRVTTVRNSLPGPRLWAVLRRSLSAPVELKFHLSNAPLDCERRDLAQMSGWRWSVETSFAEAKGEVGMDHYETRSWLGWHHHMVQSSMAHLFCHHRVPSTPQPCRLPLASKAHAQTFALTQNCRAARTLVVM